jgi:hypothetical protein
MFFTGVAVISNVSLLCWTPHQGISCFITARIPGAINPGIIFNILLFHDRTGWYTSVPSCITQTVYSFGLSALFHASNGIAMCTPVFLFQYAL